MTSNNMYRVGDFVYFEVSAAAPYQIRKIEELNKTSTGAVEAKVVCFYRRRDLSLNLIQLADKHQKELSHPSDGTKPELLHQLRHREIFLSRHLETLPATHIRGKCTVTLHNDTEPCDVYLAKDDAFFFQLVYDPLQKTLQADRGQIREGTDYQADVPPYTPPNSTESIDSREELRWSPNSGLSDTELDSFLLLSRSLGTLGRAYHAPSTLRQPSLAMSAAAAARDATHQLALDTLHAAGYDVTRALQRLSPNNQPLVKLDEMEQWSASEGNLFEEALCKYGKCFYDIQSDFLPWKHPKSLIEFYYMWKTTDHYIQQKRIKAAEAEHHLKQVYIPNYNKPNPSVLYPNPDGPSAPTGCEGCNAANSLQWYALGPATSPLKVCADCWAYWKRYGDLKAASILDKVSDPSSTNPSHSTNLFVSNDRSGSKPDMIKPVPHKTLVPPQPPRPAHHHNPSAPTTTGVPDEDQLAAVVGRLVHKPRSGINFHFLAPIPLRVARRLRPICRPVRRQGRRPFKRLASCSALYAETTQLLTKLDSIRAQQLLQLIMCRQTEMSARARTEALHLLFTRIFPNRFPVPANSSQSSSSGPTRLTTSAPCTDADTATVNSKSTNPVSAMNGVTDTDPTTVVAQKRPAPTDDDNPTVSPDHHPAKRALLSEKRVFAATTEKPAVISDTVPNNSTVAVFVGPRRRLGMGTDENGAATLMFRATDTIKRCRRKLLSVTELRRFGRHPWSRRSPNSCTTPNGTEPHSITDRVNGSVGRESNRDASTIARTNPIGSAGTSARVREEINGPPALNSSPSTANQPVAP